MSSNYGSLWQSVAPNPSPKSFWNGKRVHDGLVPDNIIFFPRTYEEAPPANAPGGYHPRYVFDAVLGGSLVLQIGARWHLLKEGEVALIFPHQYHLGGSAVDHRPVNLAVTTFDLEADTAIQSLKDTPRRMRAVDRARFAALVEAWNAKAGGLEISARLSACLQGLCDAPIVEPRKVVPPIEQQKGELYETILSLQNSGAGDTVAELATAMGVGQAALRDRFRQYTGMSLPDFLRNRRLERAIRLLEQPELSISEISERLRFSSVQTFSRVFKERYGVSPKRYEATVQRNLSER